MEFYSEKDVLMIKVSVITVNYNSKEGLKKTIRSVTKQSYRNIEHIIIDGDSNDGSKNLLKKNDQITYISESDDGIYDAMNKGIKLATGDIIGFLNAGDIFFNDKVVEDISSLFNDQHIQGVYGDLIYVNSNNKIVRRWCPGEFIKDSFKKGWHPPHPSVYVRKEILKNMAGFRLDFKICADFEMMLRLFEKKNLIWKYCNYPLVIFDNSGLSSSWSSRFKSATQIHNILKYHGFDINFILFLWFRYKDKLIQIIKR